MDQKATALESQLNKSLDTSPAAAKVMLELVDLYYKEGRVFGLVRVGERFVKSQSSHGRHREVMLKLIDALRPWPAAMTHHHRPTPHSVPKQR